MVSKINKLKMDGGLMTKMSAIYSGTPTQPGIGFAGLWAGFTPRVIMIGTLTGLQWYVMSRKKLTKPQVHLWCFQSSSWTTNSRRKWQTSREETLVFKPF
jgi:hypothetical protein